MVAVLVLLLLPMAVSFSSRIAEGQVHWSQARRDTTHQAPDPAVTPEAVVQVYAARAYSWRGAFGVHTWFATKRAGAPGYIRYEVMGWSVRHGGEAVRISNGVPDGYWFGSMPEILVELRGEKAAAAIDDIHQAALAYPYNDRYTLWPGPNSNTFTAFVARQVPQLKLDLPPTAIGKDYLTDGLVAKSPSGTGVQVSILGLAGLLFGLEEGFEVNLLGLTFGIDFNRPALKLPGIGRIGA
ncbi:MAG: DUF3750 domain-containing protein [Rhodospirillaceae bacterium]|nr:DUF3750 domain-containing protein [Rhodospirillaceae bacterium]MBT6140353.1 DUF3750 domain-containing protein [Rhodospirillaceae bacterium]